MYTKTHGTLRIRKHKGHVCTWDMLDTSMYIDTQYVLSLIIANVNRELLAIFIFRSFFHFFFFLSTILLLSNSPVQFYLCIIFFRYISIERYYPSIVSFTQTVSPLFHWFLLLSFSYKTTSNITFNLSTENLGERMYVHWARAIRGLVNM